MSPAAVLRSPFERWWASFQTIPLVPRMLALAGAIPFIALAPPVSKHLTWVLPYDIIENSAMFQVGYGISIVTFLGAVHWGLAMGSAAMASPLLARVSRESYLWSVVPSLASFWLVGVEPGPASLLLCLLLPACYVVDKARANYLPVWYLTLRGPVTLLATFGLLLTATYYIYLEADRVAAAAAEAEQREQQQQLQQQQQQQQQPQAKAA
ncbi:hypothetical protein MNEG_10785 [Monoraphidium neglectum]|uniref:Uncharacterized protein n=1 Tax=Monoraphidium neglectum TaxID=145388 RepID=A0A0D2M7V2_9CHLO|nr:hypothetical protein MNEG_10785 [Monoraphidium neglectum]KIY97176.1 hypothetical protein MNEG_10785 [Monoraphidium neglectum]|eukprot:XP_013896196.1 hypothetical protein MNEG_10785 [Monoraphidium neglectum]